MRNGQNKRMRGRNRNKGAQSLDAGLRIQWPGREDPGDRIPCCREIPAARARCARLRRPGRGRKLLAARRALFRLIAAAQEQFRQNNPYYQRNGRKAARTDESFDGDDDDGFDDGRRASRFGDARGEQPALRSARPATYLPRDAQFYPPRDTATAAHAAAAAAARRSAGRAAAMSIACRPSSPAASRAAAAVGQRTAAGQWRRLRTGAKAAVTGQRGDRFPLHRRRRRHRGPRNDMPSMPEMGGQDGWRRRGRTGE